MAWQRRGNRLYDYRSIKHRGKVTTDYFGGESELRAQHAALEGQARHTARTQERQEQQAWEALESQLATLGTLTTLLSQSLLVVDGRLYRHNRGSGARGEHQLTDPIQHYLANPEEFHHLVQAAVSGDRTVLPQVRALLDSVPQWSDELGNLLQQSENSLLDMTVGQHMLKREAITRDLDTHEQRLREEPSYVEALLIQQIRLDLLMLSTTQQRAVERRDVHSDKLLNSAHKRFLAAIKTLDQLRKLVPKVNLNIATNQINMS